MENASKALLMAAGVLVGVLIISVGVALFSSFAGSNKNIINRLEESKVSEFNNNFLKYYGDNIEVTAHDVITMINVARQNNIKYEVQDNTTYNNNSYYIRIKLKNNNNVYNFFEKESESTYINFIKDNMLVKDQNGKDTTTTKLFKCTNIITSTVTGRVIFVEIEDEN